MLSLLYSLPLPPQMLTYISPAADVGYGTVIGDDLPNNKYISLVDATLNANKPCSQPTIAAATADSQHSGTARADAVLADLH